MSQASFGVVRRYVEAWKAADPDLIVESVDPQCVIIESHGPTYRGSDQVGRWAESWFAKGNRVERWDIVSWVVSGEVCAFEWVFSYSGEQGQRSFEGASFATLRSGKIATLREYRMTEMPHEWDG